MAFGNTHWSWLCDQRKTILPGFNLARSAFGGPTSPPITVRDALHTSIRPVSY